MVTLICGAVVPGDSEAWRLECEARHVLNLRTKSARHSYLERVQSRRGKGQRDELEDMVWRVWRAARTAGDSGA